MWKAQPVVLNQHQYNDLNPRVYKFYSNVEEMLKYL